MKAELERFRAEMKAVFVDTERLLEGLGEAEARKRPSEGAWSIAECLDHLTITAQAYVPAVEEALAAGEPKGRDDYKPGWLWRKFLESLESPVKRKFKTSAPFIPETARGLAEVRRDFIAAHQWVFDQLDALDELDLGRIKVESPFAKWMRYPLGLVFYILPAHCRRHLWQAKNVKAVVVPAPKT